MMVNATRKYVLKWIVGIQNLNLYILFIVIFQITALFAWRQGDITMS